MRQLLLVLLIAATTSVSATAQKDYRKNDRDNRRNEKYDRDGNYDKYDRDDNRYDKNGRNKQELRRQLTIINRNYDSKINSVRRNPFIRSRVKASRIQDLEYQRRVALNECRARFSRQRDYAGEDRKIRRDRR